MPSYPLTPAQISEVAFISGVTGAGTIAATSFQTWNGDTPATYSAGSDAAKWGYGAAGTGATVSYAFDPGSSWTATEQAAFVATLDLWSAVANVSFVQVADASSAGIDLKRGSDGTAYEQSAYTPGSAVGSSSIGVLSQATVSIDTSVGGFGPIGTGAFDNYGGYVWMTMLHEEGHALGLGHAGPYNDGTTNSNADTAQLSAYDTREYSIMSYVDPDDTGAAFYSQYANHPQWGTSSGSTPGYVYDDVPTTWMPLDILAIQALYGPATSGPLSSGGQVFGFNTNITGPIAQFFDFTINTKPVITLYDSGPGNTLDLSGFSAAAVVDLHQGAYSSVDGLTDNIAIAYGTRIDTVIGGSFSDTLIANDDGDTLIGGWGNDTMIGGAGADTFKDTSAHLSGDIIYAFDAGDRIDITDASYASFTYVFASSNSGSYSFLLEEGNLAENGSNIGVSDLPQTTTPQADPVRVWHLSVSADVNGGVDLTFDGAGLRQNDFNADGHADILWRDAATGVFSVWEVSGNTAGSTVQQNTMVGNVAPSWQLEGASDFNGDGRADLYWFNPASGVMSIWTSTGSYFQQNAYVDSVGPGWTLDGLGDFNGDGQTDILWRNTASGVFSIWDATNSVSGGATSIWSYASSYAHNSYVNGSVDPSWRIQAVGDFNGDGKDDLLWRNSAGVISVWQSTGTGFTANTYVNGSVDTSWHIAGVGDFNGDGKDDLLWRSDSGTLSIWTSTGAGFTLNTYVTTVDPVWAVVQVGDFNDDGKADILFRNTATGMFTEWDSTGNGFTQNVLVNGSVSTDWSVVAHHYDII